MRSQLRRVVLATTHWPVLGRLYRGYYRLCLVVLRRFFRRNGRVVEVFANRSYPAGDWVAGYSDIDLVVVVAEKPPEDEVLWLDTFWRKFQRLRSWFPILSTTQIMTRAELDHWGRFGSARRREMAQWWRLYARKQLT